MPLRDIPDVPRSTRISLASFNRIDALTNRVKCSRALLTMLEIDVDRVLVDVSKPRT